MKKILLFTIFIISSISISGQVRDYKLGAKSQKVKGILMVVFTIIQILKQLI